MSHLCGGSPSLFSQLLLRRSCISWLAGPFYYSLNSRQLWCDEQAPLLVPAASCHPQTEGAAAKAARWAHLPQESFKYPAFPFPSSVCSVHLVHLVGMENLHDCMGSSEILGECSSCIIPGRNRIKCLKKRITPFQRAHWCSGH